jgi:hypothetical protein
MKKLDRQRLAVLVDAENLEIHARNTFRRYVDYKALFEAVNGREVVRAVYFKPRECPPRLQTFLEEGLGVEVKLPAKNVDTWLAITAVTLAEKVDTIALVGGDGTMLRSLGTSSRRAARLRSGHGRGPRQRLSGKQLTSFALSPRGYCCRALTERFRLARSNMLRM